MNKLASTIARGVVGFTNKSVIKNLMVITFVFYLFSSKFFILTSTMRQHKRMLTRRSRLESITFTNKMISTKSTIKSLKSII